MERIKYEKLKPLMLGNKISYEKKWKYIKNLTTDDWMECDLHRIFLSKSFNFLMLEDRQNNIIWMESFNNLLKCSYGKNVRFFDESYKPYCLYRLCRDNKLPQKIKKLVYQTHRNYYLNYDENNNELIEFIRMFYVFIPYLIEEDYQKLVEDYYILLDENELRSYYKVLIDNLDKQYSIFTKERLNKLDQKKIASKLLKVNSL